MSVRRVDSELVEVLFAKPIPLDSPSGVKLLAWASECNAHLLKDGDVATGAVSKERDYVRFLQSLNVSKGSIAAFRSALDDSKKATRERMRGNR